MFDATLKLVSFAANIKSNPVKTADTAVADPGEGPGGGTQGGRPPLFLDQTKARRAEKNFFADRPPLSQGRGDRAPPLFQDLDSALNRGGHRKCPY